MLSPQRMKTGTARLEDQTMAFWLRVPFFLNCFQQCALFWACAFAKEIFKRAMSLREHNSEETERTWGQRGRASKKIFVFFGWLVPLRNAFGQCHVQCSASPCTDRIPNGDKFMIGKVLQNRNFGVLLWEESTVHFPCWGISSKTSATSQSGLLFALQACWNCNHNSHGDSSVR